MSRREAALILLAVLLHFASVCVAAEKKTVRTYTDPAQTDADFAIQGEYAGELDAGSPRENVGVQVIALGGGRFHAVLHPGGLPGDGTRQSEQAKSDAAQADDQVTFRFAKQMAQIKDGRLTLFDPAGRRIGQLQRIVRLSPTLGAKPAQGALILFNGKSADQFEGGRTTADALLTEGGTSKRKFQDFKLHLEFRTPYMPEARGQSRGNSGCYLQGRYEVQILDSFGLAPKHDECGGIFQVRAPDSNACYPPLAWQTFDVDYTAARFDSAGKKVANGRLTLRHNGVVVHNNIELPGGTASPDGPQPGPIYLQDHGNPVRFRNIWIVEKK